MVSCGGDCVSVVNESAHVLRGTLAECVEGLLT